MTRGEGGTNTQKSSRKFEGGGNTQSRVKPPGIRRRRQERTTRARRRVPHGPHGRDDVLTIPDMSRSIAGIDITTLTSRCEHRRSPLMGPCSIIAVDCILDLELDLRCKVRILQHARAYLTARARPHKCTNRVLSAPAADSVTVQDDPHWSQ